MRIHVASDAMHPALDQADELVSFHEASSGLIRVIGRGQWSSEKVQRHFVDLGQLIAERRRAEAPVLVLVDVRDSLVQQAETVERIARAMTSVYQESDRVAVVVSSSLLKMQLKRLGNIAKVEFFVSMNAARTWLTAYH